ncbi:hypothetical protein JK358_08775 [Nocardia sp. 2]|uniref:Beta-ketoacyl-[acyl-carrier-protein] synthase III N-terminal domain-containing protein n=1 Tax=Nocardia acididurans TaxID=2802282 RepID=A0ABS1M1T3_9NOCA|nr:hypothetical protein [Nocardia acididurans]MBL1074489.1 hypothetical protein [Nocardia acididurans]
MSVVIEQSSISTAPAGSGSIDLAVAAGRECLERAGIEPGDIDVLINVGVYRDGNVVEPANSALIQLGLGMHLDYEAGSGRSTFSLDLRNGACGVLNAAQAATALLRNGTAQRVLIVGSDAHPGGISAAGAGFRYATVGAAWLLSKGVDAGFSDITITPARGRAPGTNPGVAGFLDLKTMGNAGQQSITVQVADDYATVLADTAADTLRAHLDRSGLDAAKAVLVTNNPVPGLAADLAGRFGFARGYQAMTGDRDAGSSGLAIAYHQLHESGALGAGTRLVLLAAGSGPMAAAATYRVAGAA